MSLDGNLGEHHSHNNSIEYMYDFLIKYPNEKFLFCEREYIDRKGLHRQANKMEEMEVEWLRDYKINKLLI